MEDKNNYQENRWLSFRNNISKFLDKDGFYFILFLCICIVATTAVWVSNNNLNKYKTIENNDDLLLAEEPDSDVEFSLIDEEEDINIPDIEVVEVTNDKEPKETKDKETKSTEKQKTKAVSSSKVTVKKKAKSKVKSMIMPVIGTISMDYAEDKLVYSKTLEQWTTHNGIDIKAREGSVVKAVLDGTVTQIKNDHALGIVITIDHGNGLVTKYGNLSTDEMVTIGQKVKQGDPISGVGKGAGFELAQGPHLHFEVIKNGKNVDPKLYLPKFTK
ncbi:M23 family metallopeptidase [Caloranaerobacter ferrireducens]|uniref:M23 family metallopeptidase n=1 Tax=Caloranaerobacter ferrireducens TaxID=1323370 RepID=UPI001FA7D0F6|nr:M23 family metallopeptidase [Caloranaerobacter ferrireducens]